MGINAKGIILRRFFLVLVPPFIGLVPSGLNSSLLILSNAAEVLTRVIRLYYYAIAIERSCTICLIGDACTFRPSLLLYSCWRSKQSSWGSDPTILPNSDSVIHDRKKFVRQLMMNS